MYYLVLLKGDTQRISSAIDEEHETFIDALIAEGSILLGGGFSESEPYFGGYLLFCSSFEEAKQKAEADPYLKSKAAEAEIRTWELVGIDLNAVNQDLVVGEGADAVKRR